MSITLGMLRQHKYNFVDIYKEEAISAIKNTLVGTVMDAVSVVDNEGEAIQSGR